MTGRNARAGLPHLYRDRPDREGRDRLEILTALIDGPSFDPIYRPDVIQIPRQHPIYRWECVVDRCERTRSGGTDLCTEHLQQWAGQRGRGVGKAAFLTAATGLERRERVQEQVCRVCPQRPTAHAELRLCQRHLSRWDHEKDAAGDAPAAFTEWLAEQLPLPGYGACQAPACVDLADSPLRLCDLEAEWTEEALQRLTTENTTLKQRVRELSADNRVLDERLKAARSNLRFQDRRLADLETQLADPATVT